LHGNEHLDNYVDDVLEHSKLGRSFVIHERFSNSCEEC